MFIQKHLYCADVPIAQLQLGNSLRLDDLKEGDNIVFECNVRAVPWISRVFWRLNVRPHCLYK